MQKTRGPTRARRICQRAPDILCCPPRLTCGTRNRSMRVRVRLVCYGFSAWEAPCHRTRPADRVHSLRGDAVHEHVHVICIILQGAQCRTWLPGAVPPCAQPSSDGTLDGMPSRFLTARHCVSHLLLHSACVMRMCCGVGLSMAGLSHYITNKHDLSRVQLLLRYSTSYDGIFNGTVRTSCS